MHEDVLGILQQAIHNSLGNYPTPHGMRLLHSEITRAGLSVVRTGSISTPAAPPPPGDGWREKAAALAEALRAYRIAQSRMLNKWSEGDAALKRLLWSELHACENAGHAALAAYDSPSPPSPVDGWRTPFVAAALEPSPFTYLPPWEFYAAHYLVGSGLTGGDLEGHIRSLAQELKQAAERGCDNSSPPPVRTQEESVVAREWAAFDGMMEEHAAALTGTHVGGRE